jgi:hypothetical protein
MHTTLPPTTCPACWQRKDDLAGHYCAPCRDEFSREYGDPHGPDCCEDLQCRLCFSQTGDNDFDGPEVDEDHDEPYGDRDFREDVGL